MAQKPANFYKMSPEDQALWELINAGDEFTSGGAPVFSAGDKLQYENMDPAQLAQLQRSGMADVSTDSRYRDAQLDSLNQLDEISRTGMTARDEADMLRLQQDVNRQNRGRVGAIQQSMASRGMSGSGLDLVAQMQAAQDATEREALAALEKNAQIGERKQQAMMQRGQLATGYRDQDFGEQAAKAQAQDAINRFNTANQVQAQFQNNQGRNQTNQANWQRTNQTSDKNTQAGYDFRKDQYGVQQNNSQMKYNKAVEDWNRAEMRKQQRRQRNAGFGSLAGGIAGGIIGSYGGPAGAAAGYQIGSSLGGTVGGFAQGGKIPGVAPFPGDDPRNDIYTAQVSADEIIVPRTAAQDPATAAEFAASAASEPEDQFSSIKNPTVRQYMRDKYAAQQGLESAQKTQDMLGYANIAGKALTDFGNSQKQDVILKNRIQDLGGRPDVVEAKRSQWDGSTLDKLGSMGVDRAQGKLKTAKDDFSEGVAIDKLNRESEAYEKSLAKEKAVNDPNSEESLQAREYLRQIAPGVAEKMANFEGLSAAQIEKVAPGLFDKYKVDVSERNTDKRLEAQINADERRYQRDQDRQEKREKNLKYKRSVEIRKELSQNPAFKALSETEARLAQVDELVKNPNGVTDEAMLVMYQKALDPGSVVREGEFARTTQGQDLITRVDTIMGQVAKGNRLTPDLRLKVVSAMKALRDGNRTYMQRVMAPYEREIRDYDLDRNIITGPEAGQESLSTSSSMPNKLNSAKDLP